MCFPTSSYERCMYQSELHFVFGMENFEIRSKIGRLFELESPVELSNFKIQTRKNLPMNSIALDVEMKLIINCCASLNIRC